MVISGCSSKQYFKPTQKTLGDWKNKEGLHSSLVDVGASGAVLADGNVLYKDKIIDLHLDTQDQRLVNVDDDSIITATIDGNLTVISAQNHEQQEHYTLKKTIAAATVKDGLLAVVFASNELAIYSTQTKEILFQSQGNTPLVVDTKIVNPYFLNDLVLFLTLDGKIIIVNSKEKKILRTIIVSSADNFDNITAFNVINNNLLAATGYKILSLEDKEIREPYEIRTMKYDPQDGIYIATKDGTVYNLTSSLQVKAKMKFPFAHFLGMILTDKRVYLLETQGYIIALPKDLSSFELYNAKIDSESYIYTGDKAFYVNDSYFSIK